MAISFISFCAHRVNDCILRVNNLDCRDVERAAVLNALRNSASTPVSVLVRRRKVGRQYQAVLNCSSEAGGHGLTLDLGVYVAKIQPGSAAAKEGSIAIGDRILSINDRSVEHVDDLGDAVKVLNNSVSSSQVLTLTLAKSSSGSLSGTVGVGMPLSSSSSSGHNIILGSESGGVINTVSATTSPIKDTIRGSQEFVKRLMTPAASGQHKEGRSYSGLASSSSSEKVYQHSRSSVSASLAKESKTSLMETVKEKFDNVRGRRKSKEPAEAYLDKGSSDVAIAELDSVLDAEDRTASYVMPAKANKKKRRQDKSAPDTGSSGGGGGGGGSGSKVGGTFFFGGSGGSGGGTWPRTRGGPVIDGTGTILHPQKMKKKERMPLAELLNNLPKYPPERKQQKSLQQQQQHSESNAVVHRNDTRQSRSTRSRSRPSIGATAYLESSSSAEQPNSGSRKSATEISPDNSVTSAHPEVSRVKKLEILTIS